MNNDRIIGLQVARGLAALTVVIYHAKQILIRFTEGEYIELPFFYEHGQIAVHFFFVISGFIICYVVDRHNYSSKTFVIKRFFRIWPTYFFCTILFSLIYLLNRDLVPSDVGYSFISLLTSISIFPQINYPLLQPGWSLEHEVLFYLFVLFITIFISNNRVKFIFYSLFFITTLSITLRFILPLIFDFKMFWDYHFFSKHNIYFLFGTGVYIFWCRTQKKGIEIPHNLLITIGAILILATPYVIQYIAIETSLLKQQKVLLNVFLEAISSSLLIFGLIGIAATSKVSKGLSSIGNVSYSLYLSHFLLVPIFHHIHKVYIKWDQAFAEILCIAFVLLSILLSYIIYWSVEKPSSNYGNVLCKRLFKS